MRQPTTLRRHVLILYFGLTFGFSWLLFIPAALLLRDRPGASPAEVPGVAPLQTAGAAAPSLVAIALASLLYGRQGLRQLFGGFRRWRVGIRWYLTAIFLAPLLTLVALGLRALLDGDFAVDPDSELGKALADVGLAALLVSLPLVFVVSLFTSPLLEEPGWRGFALPHLQDRLTALAAGAVLGVHRGAMAAPDCAGRPRAAPAVLPGRHGVLHDPGVDLQQHRRQPGDGAAVPRVAERGGRAAAVRP
jgi:uncharacterized protein